MIVVVVAVVVATLVIIKSAGADAAVVPIVPCFTRKENKLLPMGRPS